MHTAEQSVVAVLQMCERIMASASMANFSPFFMGIILAIPLLFFSTT